MNQQIEETTPQDQDALLQKLTDLVQEVEARDLPRLEKLNRSGKFNEAKHVGAELVGTVTPIMMEFAKLATQLITEHQEGIVQVEDVTYHDMPRAIQILASALRSSNLISEADAKQVSSLVGEGSAQDSVLSRADAELIMGVLLAFKTIATQMASSKEGDEAEQANATIETIDAVIARVSEISVPPEMEEDDAADDEEQEDDDDG